MPQSNRIKSSDEIKAFLNQSTKKSSPSFILFLKPKKKLHQRFAFIVGKKCGKASTRNRLRRKLKECIRKHQHNLNLDYDYIIMAKPALSLMTYAQLQEQFQQTIL